MLDLVSFVLMAAAMGLIAAITLAAVALLFASQAQASEAREATLVMRRVESQEPMRAPLHSSAVASRVSPARASDAPLKRAAMPTHFPEGCEYDKVFGQRTLLSQKVHGSLSATASPCGGLVKREVAE